eukprot:scaffold649184_cov45-Prasinocladus_malaysianus.AAC.1
MAGDQTQSLLIPLLPPPGLPVCGSTRLNCTAMGEVAVACGLPGWSVEARTARLAHPNVSPGSTNT